MELDTSVRYLKGVGPKRADILAKLGVLTVKDLLHHLPRSYGDRSHILPIAQIKATWSAHASAGEESKDNSLATIKARVKTVSTFFARTGRRIFTVRVSDDSGALDLVWFHSGHLKADYFPVGREMYFTGKVDFYTTKGRARLQMVSPSFEDAETGGVGAVFGTRILPEYPLSEGLSQGIMRSIVKQALDACVERPSEAAQPRGAARRSCLDAILKGHNLPLLNQALWDVHFPPSLDRADAARRRFVYEEFFLLELSMALRRRAVRREPGHAFRITPEIEAHFRALFPFSLTKAQERAIAEIAADMRRPEPMNRLLQGDVGSGKTVVAMFPLLVAVANKHQAAIMTPTEILAEQHFARFGEYLRHGRVRMALLRGGAPDGERRAILDKTKRGEIDLIVGTHALIEKDVAFMRLGAVVIDEQHKFGVLQRQKLLGHAGRGLRTPPMRPDALVMTATPIPRTLALTVFGDLDFSMLDEMPPGRQPVETRCIGQREVRTAYKFMADRLRLGEQGYVIYPLVEESEKLDVKAASEMAERLQAGPFRDFRVGLLHGRMERERKELVMQAFHRRDVDVLVATQVVEVGVDVARATVMIVEHAERFGLAQLHQLRGRIGRGSDKSCCFLVADPGTREARQRLEILTRTSDGFKIAEEDLRLRGPGEFFGARQHGLPELKIADMIGDFDVLRLARKDAFRVVECMERLERPDSAPGLCSRSDPPCGGSAVCGEGGRREALKATALLAERFGDGMELIHVG